MQKVIRAGMSFFLALILVGELLALPASAKVSGLERIHADPDGTWYINAKTMVNPDRDRISFWSTVVPNKDSAYYEVLGKVLEKHGKNPSRLEYVQILQEVDCSTGKINSLNVLFYGKQDRIVHTVNSPDSAQLIAKFGQAENSLLAAVCGSQLAQFMGK